MSIKLRRTIQLVRKAFQEIDKIELSFTEDDYFVRISRDSEEWTETQGNKALTRVTWHLYVTKEGVVLIDKETDDRKTVIQMLTRVFKALDL